MNRKATSDLWWRNAIFYCLDVQTYLDSDGDGTGDLPGLTDRIDYLSGLGVSCLWLMPFYRSPGRDDGYDISDFYSVDDRLGTAGDFTELVRTARDRGIRVIADLVVNHTSADHRWFQAARSDPTSPYKDFYVWREDKPEEKPGDVVFPDKENSNWAYDDAVGQWYLHRFYSHQPDLNIANPAVRDEITQVVGYWLAQGVSGFRVDAVPFLIEPVGLPEGAVHDPHELLRDLRKFVNRRNGEAVMLGEVNLPPDEQRKFYGDEGGDELHMILNFSVNQAMYLSMAREQAQPLVDAMRNLPDLPEDAQWANFARNHDELTLDKLSDDERNEVFAAFGPEPEMQLYGRGLRRRLPSMLDGDQRRLRMVYSLVFSLPGTPVLFYGEEIGMAENLDIEGRLSVRSPMQWSQDANGGFSTVDDTKALARPVVGGDFGPAAVNVAAQRRDTDSLLNWMERLIRRRRECPELGWGQGTVLDVEADDGEPSSVLVHRCDWDGGTVVAAHNLAGRAVEVSFDVDTETDTDAGTGTGTDVLVDLFADEEHRLDRDARVTVRLEPYGYRWWRVRRRGGRPTP